jgi:hypothetical protein
LTTVIELSASVSSRHIGFRYGGFLYKPRCFSRAEAGLLIGITAEVTSDGGNYHAP